MLLLKRKFLLVTICLLMLLISCSKKNDKKEITNEAFGNLIKEVYSMPRLEKYDFYRDGDTIYTDYYFNEDVNRRAIMNSWNMTLQVFVIKRDFDIGNGIIKYDWEDSDRIVYRALVDEKIVVERDIKKNKHTIIESKYNENTDIELPGRADITVESLRFENDMKEKYDVLDDIVFEKSFNGYVLFVKFKGSEKFSEKQIDEVKRSLGDTLALQLAESSARIYGSNTDYMGIVAQFYAEGKKYKEAGYDNGIKKGWFREDWKEHKFNIPGQK